MNGQRYNLVFGSLKVGVVTETDSDFPNLWGDIAYDPSLANPQSPEVEEQFEEDKRQTTGELILASNDRMRLTISRKGEKEVFISDGKKIIHQGQAGEKSPLEVRNQNPFNFIGGGAKGILGMDQMDSIKADPQKDNAGTTARMARR